MAYSVKMQIRDQYIRNDGKTNFRLSVYINRKRKYYPVDVYIDPKHWNGSKIMATNPRNKELNQILKDKLIFAEDTILNILKSNQNLTIETFEQKFLSSETKNNTYTLSDAFNDYTSYHQNQLKKSTLKVFKSQKTKIEAFAGSNFPLNQVDEIFYIKFRKYLIDEKFNSQNTLTTSLKKLKAIINFAIKTGKIEKNNLAQVQEKIIKTHRESLTQTELETLENLLAQQQLPKKLNDVLVLFLFSCYTSIRFSDIQSLNYSNIQDNFLIFTAQKTENETQKKINIPITAKTKFLIENYGNQNRNFNIFKKISNQKTNDYLKIILLHAKINRNLTFHSARHTFAMLSLNNGMPMEYVQQFLGHSKITTTEIYAQYQKQILNEMSEKYLSFSK